MTNMGRSTIIIIKRRAPHVMCNMCTDGFGEIIITTATIYYTATTILLICSCVFNYIVVYFTVRPNDTKKHKEIRETVRNEDVAVCTHR